ncbi:MAG: protein kinase [Planctomycetota bacterium]|nr:protein kinase [Planctomycetota bacterium]
MASSLTGRTLGGYLIEEELGRGAMGVVFKAKQLSMDRHVALKFLPKRLAQSERVVARFLREARAAGRLSHPNLVGVHDAGVVEGFHFIAMEFVDGNSVHKRVREKGPYSEKEALDIAGQVAEALKYAHAHGILHRDIKPDNFLVDSSGRVRLADLGLARFQDTGDKQSAEVTQDGMAVGTPHYMSPEQCSGGKVDARSDIYSLGASMYVLATGHTPYDAPTAAAVMVKTLTEPPTPLRDLNPNLSAGFVALVERMLAKDPAKRFQDAQQVVDAVEKCRKGLFKPTTREHARVGQVPLEPIDTAPRYKLLLYGAGAAVVALVLVGAFLRWRGGSTPPAVVNTAQPESSDTPKTEPATAPKTEPKTAAGPETKSPPPKAEPKTKVEPGGPMASLSDNEKPEHLAAIKKLRMLKLDLGEKLQQDPDLVISKVDEFLKQHPGARIASIAEEFLTRAKEAKAKLEKDWQAAKTGAEEQAVTGNKSRAFHILRDFVDEHGGTKQASTAQGMMLGWVADLRAEADKAAEAGHYTRAEEMLTLTDSKLPDDITGPLKKELERVQAEHQKARVFIESDSKQFATLYERTGALAKETDTATGKRYEFLECTRVWREGASALKTPSGKKDVETIAGVYERAAAIMERMRTGVNSSKAVPMPGLGSFREPGLLTAWEDRSLSFKPKSKDLEPQPIPWKQITGENLLLIAQALKIGTSNMPSDLLDTGALAFAAGVTAVAIEKLQQAGAADRATKATADVPLRLLRPAAPGDDRELAAKKLFADAAAARDKKDADKVLELQKRLVVEFADTDFVQIRRRKIQDLSAGLESSSSVSSKKEGEKPKVAEAKVEPKTEPKAEPKAEPKTEPKAEPKTEPKVEPKKEEDPAATAIAELKKYGWTEVKGNWAQDPKRKTTFTVTGGGQLLGPFLDAAMQVTFHVEEGSSIGVYARHLPDTSAIKDLRTTLETYSLVLGCGYGVLCTANTVKVFGDKAPSASAAGTTRGTYERKTQPLKVFENKPIPPGAHTVTVSAQGEKLEITFDGKMWRTADKLRNDGGVAIIIEGGAKIDSPLLRK